MGELGVGADVDLVGHGDLAAAVELERAVRGAEHLDTLQCVHCSDDVTGVLGVAAVDPEVADDVVATGLVDVDRPDVAPGLTDGGGYGAEDAGSIVDPHPHQDLVSRYGALVLVDDACLGDARGRG